MRWWLTLALVVAGCSRAEVKLERPVELRMDAYGRHFLNGKEMDPDLIGARLAAAGIDPRTVRTSITMSAPDPAPEGHPPVFRVTIDPQGAIRLGDRQVDEAQLAEAAEAFAATDDAEGLRCVIEADRSASHAQFVRVVDVLRNAGLTRYAIDVSPRASDE